MSGHDSGRCLMQVTTIGFDIAKCAFQVHGADRQGRAVLKRKLARSKVLVFFANLPPCLVGARGLRWCPFLGTPADTARA